MKIERNLMKMSLLDTLLYFVLLFVFINGIIFLFTIIITGEPKIFISDGSWISQLLFPFLYSVIHNSINRNGVVKITDYSDFDYLKEQIEQSIIKNRLHVTNIESDSYIYKRKSKIGRIFGFFAGEKVTIKYSDTQIQINSKKNILIQIEQGLK
jgi:hypothetical protein